MKLRWYFAFLGSILVTFLSSCEVLNFSKDFSFDISYVVNSDSTSVNAPYLIDAMDYVSSIEQYSDKIESLEITSMTCKVSSFEGADDQMLTNALLTISNEDGTISQPLTIIPSDLLQNYVSTEKSLVLDDAGIILAEDLIKNVPHKCLGVLTGEVSSSPVSFTMTFHVEIRVTGKIL